METPVEKDPRVYFAAERTFLAWIRTGLGLMAVGFAVSRFGLFLRQIRASDSGVAPTGTSVSGWSGIAIVFLGVLVNIVAIFRHYQLVNELRSGTWEPGHVSRDGVFLAAILAVAGVGMAVYLMSIR